MLASGTDASKQMEGHVVHFNVSKILQQIFSSLPQNTSSLSFAVTVGCFVTGTGLDFVSL